jgi:branched-chain amino acid transport system permease protein
VRNLTFALICVAVAVAVFVLARLVGNDYVFFAGYVVLQYIVLATAWNILGGYTGYVNFGSAAFFALGAYATVFLHKAFPVVTAYFVDEPYALPIPVLIVVGAVISGFVGLGMGYLTLRLRGAFFAIATLALAVVLQTFVTNWSYVGGARGAYVIRPNDIEPIGPYIQYLFLLMLALAVLALVVARSIERSRLGLGFAAIRDDELAAEASGVPTLKLKLIATTISGALMGMAGAPFPYYIGYLQPSSAFALDYAVNSIAMPMIGGTTSWIGPLIGAILLGSLQQVATVTISSSVNLLIVGLLIVDCVIIAPTGILGLVQGRRTARAVVADPAVFVLLFVVNVIPIYFLHQEARGALPPDAMFWTIVGYLAFTRGLEVIFWAVLTYLAFARGRIVGLRWLGALPVIGAALSVIPGPSWLWLVSALALAICLGCGLVLRLREPAAGSSTP